MERFRGGRVLGWKGFVRGLLGYKGLRVEGF